MPKIAYVHSKKIEATILIIWMKISFKKDIQIIGMICVCVCVFVCWCWSWSGGGDWGEGMNKVYGIILINHRLSSSYAIHTRLGEQTFLFLILGWRLGGPLSLSSLDTMLVVGSCIIL